MPLYEVYLVLCLYTNAIPNFIVISMVTEGRTDEYEFE